MALVFALATPEPVFMFVAGKVSTHRANRTAATHLAGGCLAAFSSLRAFRRTREEQVGETLARGTPHPIVVDRYC